MPNTLRIRKANASDLDKIAPIEAAAAALFPPGRVPDAQETTPLEELQEAAGEGLLWVAEVGEELVGFCIAWPEDDRLHLEEVDVLPRFGRRGIGRALIDAVIAEARRRKLAEVTLTTFADLAWNGPYYRRLGFRDCKLNELPLALATILEDERRSGMTQRIAMRLEVEPTAER
ncbi:MAG: GNAT family N-acetyltransferase [Pseudomonadales bacterium]|nr:GNAT family N-acetyltransferase [Pseudomonadales bacterium]